MLYPLFFRPAQPSPAIARAAWHLGFSALALCASVNAQAADPIYTVNRAIHVGIFESRNITSNGNVLGTEGSQTATTVYNANTETSTTIQNQNPNQSFMAVATNNHLKTTGGVLMANGAAYQAAVKNADGSVVNLGSLSGDRASMGLAMNDQGQLTGWSELEVPGAPRHAMFVDTANGYTMRDLGVLLQDQGVTDAFSAGQAINASGQVTGYSTLGDSATVHAFITGANGGAMRDLGSLAGEYGTSFGIDINDQGQVIGDSSTGSMFGFYRAFITDANGGTMRDLGALYTGAQTWSGARGINNQGQVVGYSRARTSAGFSNHAFITGLDGNGMYDLNDFYDLPLDEYFVVALDINDAGQVLATTNLNNTYVLELTTQSGTVPPSSAVPEPSALALSLSGMALLGWRGRRRQRHQREEAGL